MNKVILSETADPRLIEYISSLGLVVEIVKNHNGSPIGSHADLYYCQLFHEKASGISNTHSITGSANVYEGDKSLVGKAYPDDCIYNAACTGRHFIHNTKITDPDLMRTIREYDMNVIHVKQGYSKCNCVTVDENSIITSDPGIAAACKGRLDCLLISPGNIRLEGYKYGFLGGCSGRISDEIVFNGDLTCHPDYHSIVEYIKMRNLKVRYFPDHPLTDIGSIISCIECSDFLLN